MTTFPPQAAIPDKAAIMVLDRSGSMADIRENTIASMNAYREGVLKQDGLTFTLITFDTISTDIRYRRAPMATLPEFTLTDLEPRGGTPLIDAACIAIKTAQQEYKDSDRVVIIIVTDGHENSSREFKLDDLHQLIKEQSAKGWQFVFLGASVDVYKDGSKYGISAGSTMSYNSRDLRRSQTAYRGVAGQSVGYYETGASMSFSDDDKTAAGDVFQPVAHGAAAPKKVTPATAPEAKKTLVDDIKL